MTEQSVQHGPGMWECDMKGLSSTRCVAVFIDGGGFGLVPVAYLTWDTTTGAVETVYVNEECRGYGVATKMLAAAADLHGSPLTDSGEYTAEGYAWAKARGLNPKMRKRVKKAEMSRVTARMCTALWGGARQTKMIEGVWSDE